MRLSTPTTVSDSLTETRFAIGHIPGILWLPARTSGPMPLVLQGHPGGLADMYPRLLARAAQSAARGHASATIELPGSGDLPRIHEMEQARANLKAALRSGAPVTDEIVDSLVLPLVEQAVPQWQAALDELQALPQVGNTVGYSGGVISIGVRLALVEPRLSAAVLFAGTSVPRLILAEARRLTLPLHVMLQWDDEHNDRQASLDLFDAFGSAEKSLHVNMGGHRGLPSFASETAASFLQRHLGPGR